MDSFDDLLARAALEENPFADPFSQPRPSSPDPWATPFGTANSTDPFASTAHHYATTDSFGLYTNTFEAASETHPESTNFNSAVNNADENDDDEPLAATLQSPGFRESIIPPLTVDSTEVQIIRSPPLLGELDGSHSRLQDSKAPSGFMTVPPTAPEGLKTPSKSGSSFASSQTLSSTLAFKSPLDPSTPTIPERSIAGLSIGGESLSGWQTEEQLPWHKEETSTVAPSHSAGPSPSADEDSDDDKPILHSLQQKQHQREAPVGLF